MSNFDKPIAKSEIEPEFKYKINFKALTNV